MSDISKRGFDCDDDCEGERGERGERGKRGKRGHRGHRGHDGHDGATGPTGPAEPVTTIVFRPGDPAGSRDNVFVTWAETYAALQALAERGILYLEFDTRFSPTVEPSTGLPSAVIPPGVWTMNNVVWTHTLIGPTNADRTFVELADGASIVLTAPFRSLRILGWNLTVFSNRTGPIAPFVDIDIFLDGTRSQLRNTLLVPGALPIWEVTAARVPNVLTISGSNAQGGLGGGALSGNPSSVSPLVDVQPGGFFVVQGGAGFVKDNALTGSGDVSILPRDDAFNGQPFASENFVFPAFTGFLDISVAHRDRWFIDLLVADINFSPWGGFLNELVRVDTSSGPAPIIEAPQATPGTRGERFSVIDYTGGASGINPILIQSAFGDTIDSPIISVAGQSKTWVSDGAGRWMLHSVATP
jgi:hypothetical protein